MELLFYFSVISMIFNLIMLKILKSCEKLPASSFPLPARLPLLQFDLFNFMP